MFRIFWVAESNFFQRDISRSRYKYSVQSGQILHDFVGSKYKCNNKMKVEYVLSVTD